MTTFRQDEPGVKLIRGYELKIAKLKEENKALKEYKDLHLELMKSCEKEVKALKEKLKWASFQYKKQIKALKEESKRLVGAAEYILEHIQPLKDSRDELLKAIYDYDHSDTDQDRDDTYCRLANAFTKAKALKEKEA